MARAAELEPIIRKLRQQGITSMYGIAKALNRRGVPTTSGSGRWHSTQVQHVLNRLRGKVRAKPLRSRKNTN